MNFDFTAEQEMLRDSLSRYFGDRYDFAQRQAVVRSAAGWRPQIWRGLAEDLGILGAPFSEQLGGLGGGAIETMIIMEEIGKALVIEPYLETVVIGGGLLRHAGGTRAHALIEQVIAGDVRFAFAQLEPGRRFELADASVRAIEAKGTWRITGLKDAVRGASFATHLLVTASTESSASHGAGVGVFIVPCDAAGVTMHGYPTVDGSRAADIRFESAAGERLGEGGKQGLEVLAAVIDEATVGLCAEAVGIMRRLLHDTVEYARQRKQFDAPIAVNQVLQHRMVDMYIALEQAVSMTYLATLKLDRPAPERIRAVAAAKAQIGKSARFIGQAAIQIHGGMGMTDELAVSHYFKRATVIESQLGSAAYHLARIEQCDAVA